MSLWVHQQRGIDETLSAIDRGERKILVTAPTGMGKTRMMAELIDHWTDQNLKVALYTNRRLLVEQTSRVMAQHGIDHGIRAASYSDEEQFCPVQVCSLQTEDARVFKRGRWKLHDANMVLIDEAHSQTGNVARKVLDTHYTEGAAYVGFTATPIGLADLYENLVVAGTTSEGRDCGALLPAIHYGPDEPDTRKLKVQIGEDLSENQVRSVMGAVDKLGASDVKCNALFGRVLEWFAKLNPDRRPTILFAPGVREPVWFAKQFSRAGIAAAHIDGENVWVEGEYHKSDRSVRAEILDGSKAGRITILCNRFVLREGVDAPWLAHGILATVFGSLQSYLQSGGRLLRACDGLEHVTIQDHGGNWHRHGSLNADREWSLEYTGNMISGIRAERLRAKKEKEPMRCPQCGLILIAGRCLCGYVVTGKLRSRPVVQTDGTLKEMAGEIFKPRREYKGQNAAQIWERMYWRSRTAKGAKTFMQAMALFAMENNWGWPSRDLHLMPREDIDLFRMVEDVPMERLK